MRSHLSFDNWANSNLPLALAQAGTWEPDGKNIWSGQSDMIPNGDQQAFASLFTHGPTVRKSMDELLSYLPLMQKAADELSVIFNQNYAELDG